MPKSDKGVNFEAYFLGPEGENYNFYEELLVETLRDHMQWRKAFSLDDNVEFVSEKDKQKDSFKRARKRIRGALYVLQEKLKMNQPFFSPRYIGHMNWEVMAAPLIAFFSAALFNPNNVAKAGSTGTSELELEAGRDFLRLFGFDDEKGWGHICCGGTIANMEALWIARNMKVYPLVLKEIALENDIKMSFVELEDAVLLRKYKPEDILDLKATVTQEWLDSGRNQEDFDKAFDAASLQERGLNWKGEGIDTGVVFLPETKHYSLKKAMDLIGLGRQSVRYVPVDEHYRMDIDILEEMIFSAAEKHPILAVVGVMGSTEESAVDRIHKIYAIREKLEKEKDMSFHLHVDAAYGGYVRSIFLDESSKFMTMQRLQEKLERYEIIGDKGGRHWPEEEVYDAFKAIKHADTVTVDPHKLGYVLYPAGGFAMRDKRMREAIQTFAPYVFAKPQPGQPDELIGSYILEGSKPGAAAAAVWTAHTIMPLNITGYGKLIGETIEGAQALWHGLEVSDPFVLEKEVKIKAYPVTKPDINIVNYVFKFEDNGNLEVMNQLTNFIAEKILGYLPDNPVAMLDKAFIVSTTDFSHDEYKDSPLSFLKRIGISEDEWKRVHNVKIIRSVVMSPYLTSDYVDDNYVTKFIDYLEKEIAKHSNEILQLDISD